MKKILLLILLVISFEKNYTCGMGNSSSSEDFVMPDDLDLFSDSKGNSNSDEEKNLPSDVDKRNLLDKVSELK